MAQPSRAQLREWAFHPNMRAFFYVIRTGEGTLGMNGYRTMFGGELFESYSDHPRKLITKPLGRKSITSSAAGAYQFLSKTWDWIAKKYGFPNFTPEVQDEGAVALIHYRGALDDVLAGRIESALAKCSKEWASLPGSPYGQPTLKLDKALQLYTSVGGTTPAPVEERTVVLSRATEEPAMSPFVVAAVSKAIEMAPDLIRVFGDGKNVEKNAQAAEKVVELAKAVTGQGTAQAAIESLESSRDLQTTFREEVHASRAEFDQLAEKRIAAAREFVKEYNGGRPVLGNFTFPELMSAFFVVGGFGLGIAVIFATDLSPEVKAAIVGALILQAVSDVRGFWFGASVSKDKGDRE